MQDALGITAGPQQRRALAANNVWILFLLQVTVRLNFSRCECRWTNGEEPGSLLGLCFGMQLSGALHVPRLGAQLGL